MKFLTHSQDTLTVQLEGMERVWGLRSRIIIPLQAIDTIDYFEHFQDDDQNLWRLGGVGMPYVLYAGLFVHGHKREFLYLRRPSGWVKNVEARNVLRIKTAGFYFHALLLSVTPDQASEVLDWWQNVSDSL